MSWRELLLVWTVLVCGRTAAAADEDVGLALRLEVGADEVPFGRAFPLTVVREWSRELVPDEFDEEQLAPLVARLEDVGQREEDGRIVETRRYQCHAFSLMEVLVAAPSFRASPAGGGPERVVAGEDLRLRVVAELDPLAPGPAEPPGALLVEPVSWTGRVVAGVVVLAALAWLMLLVIRRPGCPSVPAALPAHVRAGERLERLRAWQPGGVAQIQAFHVELAALAREYVEQRYGFHAPQKTSEEVLESRELARALVGDERALLADLLAQCDRVKFACQPSGAPDRERLLAAVDRVVRVTQVVPIAAAPANGGGQ